MSNFKPRTNSISDVIEWNNNNQLVLSPDFQRRAVWSENAKSYLIDSILRGKPIPIIFITQELAGTKNIRTVVDGQQRLRAILDFYNGDFTVKKIHNAEFAGVKFDELEEETKSDFLNYELSVNILYDMPYTDILDVFTRINSYTLELEDEELYNAKYVGHFKQLAFEHGIKYVEYFQDGKIITKKKISRMGEVGIAGDLVMNIIGGIQSTSNIETYYKKYEDEEVPRNDVGQVFDSVMSYIGSIYSAEEISQTVWKNRALFYTLFIAVAHSLHGIEGVNVEIKKLSKKHVNKMRILLDDVSSQYTAYKKDMEMAVPKDFATFFEHSTKGTTNPKARQFRVRYLVKKMKQKIE